MSIIPPNKTVPQDKDIAVSEPKLTGSTDSREQLSVVLDNLDQGLQQEIADRIYNDNLLWDEAERLSRIARQNNVASLIEGGTWGYSIQSASQPVSIQQLSVNNDWTMDPGPNNSFIAQTFTPSNNINVGTISVRMVKVGAVGTLHIDICNVSGGTPNHTSILGTSSTINTAAISAGYSVVQFTFSTPVSLSANTQYAFVVRGTNWSSGTINLGKSSLNPYAGGSCWFNENSSWTQFASNDLYFDIQGANVSGPITHLTWSAPAYIQVPGLQKERNTIAAGSVQFANNGDVAYVLLNRAAGANATLTVATSSPAAFASLPKADKENAFIVGRSLGNYVLGPNYKVTENQTMSLGATLTDQTKSLLGASEAQASPAWKTALGAPLRHISSDSTAVLPAIAGIDSELDKLFGNLRMDKHSSPSKGTIAGVDKTMLDGSVVSQELFGLFLNFTGAVIDFSTGIITKDDGSTPLGVNFVPASVPTGSFCWYGITLTPGNIGLDNRMQANVLVTQGAVGATQAEATFPVVVDGVKLGAFLVKNEAGTITVAKIYQFDIAASSSPPGGSASPLDPKETESWTYYTRSDFSVDNAKFVASTTGEDSILGLKKLKLNVGQKFETNDLTGPQVWNDALPISAVQAKILFNTNAVDELGEVEFSRDGGVNWVQATEFLPGSSTPQAFYGDMLVADASFASVSPSLIYSFGNGATISGQRIAAIIRPAYRMTVTSLSMTLSTASTAGTVVAKLFTAAYGTPQTLLATGAQTLLAGQDVISSPAPIVASIPATTLEANTSYAVVFEGTGLSGNLVGYSATTPDAQVLSSTVHNGSSWVPNAASPVCSIVGSGCDLRMRYTSGTNGAEIKGFGVNYVPDSAPFVTGSASFETRVITSTEASTGLVTLQRVRYTPGARQLEVHRNGNVFIAPSFTEIGNNKVLFPSAFLTTGQTITFRCTYGLVDGINSLASQMNSRLTAMYDAIVGSTWDIQQNRATHSTLASAIADVATGARIMLLGDVAENVTVSKRVTIEGKGYSSKITGTLSVSTAGVLINNIHISGDITLTSGSSSCFVNNCWQPSASAVFDNGSNNFYVILDA